MVEIICKKEGKAFMPKKNPFDAEYFIYHRIQQLVDKTHQYQPALDARIEMEFDHEDVVIKAVNCYDGFTSTYHMPALLEMMEKGKN